MKFKSYCSVAFLFIALLVLNGCNTSDVNRNVEYDKCTTACIGAVETGFGDNSFDQDDNEEEFVTLDLCRRECGKKFLK